MPRAPARETCGWDRPALVGPMVSGLLVCCTLSVAAASELRITPIVKAVEQAAPAVVNIQGEKTISAADFSGGSVEGVRRVNGMGTGVVIDPRGYILTNHHVVAGVRQIKVTLSDGSHFTARLVARDPETDLAIVKVDCPKPLPVITIGTSADLMPGETVIAVGNAYGYEHTITRGIVSALHRAVQVSEAQFYNDLIQTDASINPGNSGGPLLNIDGEMVGVNVAVRAGAQGIGFAIPVDLAMEAATRLLASCNATQVRHGLVPGDMKPPPGEQGVVVAEVAQDSPAARGGLAPGDWIRAIDGRQLSGALDFQRALLERRPGETLELEVVREGEPRKLQLALAEPAAPTPLPSHPAWNMLGLQLEPIAAEAFQQRFNTRYRGGLEVTGVRPGSPAVNQGIRAGDVLVGMHIWETVSLDNVAYVLNRPDLPSFSPVKFFILRGHETLYGYLPVPLRTAQR